MIDDAALIGACRSGEAGAWERLVCRFERLIYTVARRGGLDAHEAGDVFQAVFLCLFEHLHTLTQPAQVQAWLVTTARRETIRRLRERQRMLPIGGDADEEGGGVAELVDPDPLPESQLEALQLQHRARTALEAMAEPCRTLLRLLYGTEDAPPYAEIAAGMGIPVGSIGPTRARCLAKLRAQMD